MKILPYPATLDQEARAAAATLRNRNMGDEAELVERPSQEVRRLRTIVRAAQHEANEAWYVFESLKSKIDDAANF